MNPITIMVQSIATLPLDQCQVKLNETNLRIEFINDLLDPFNAALPDDTRVYLRNHGETIDFSRIPNPKTRVRLQKYLILCRALVWLNRQKTEIENRIKNIQEIFKASIQNIVRDLENR